MALPAADGLDLIAEAIRARDEDRIYQMWIVQLPVMSMSGKVMPFAEYRDRLTGANIDTRSTADILAELDEVEASFKKEGNT